MRERILAGIDLGSSAIRLAVGQVVAGPDKRETINLIGAVEVPSFGISKGAVKSLDDATAAVSACLDRVERQIGVPINDAYIGIGGVHVHAKTAKGVVGVSRPDSEIREEDQARVLDMATANANPANFEILHRIPQRFTVDDQPGVRNPVGMQGVRLEAEVCLIQGLSSHVKNLTQAVMRTNVDVSGLVFSPLATADAVLSDRQRELGAVLVNIGASTTSVAVFEDGELIHASIIPIGADHITSDIAIGLRTSLEVAESAKRSYVSAVPEGVNQYDMIDLRELGATESELVSPRFMSEIAQARVEELFEKVQAELLKIERSGMLPAGAILTGGGSKLRGMVEMARTTLRLPASLSPAPQISSPLSEVLHDPAFSTAIGLLMYGFEDERDPSSSGRLGGLQAGDQWLKKVASPFKKIFKSFIP